MPFFEVTLRSDHVTNGLEGSGTRIKFSFFYFQFLKLIKHSSCVQYVC